METLPQFRYHPSPVATGSVVASGEPCVCCSKARGFVYTSSVYGTNPPDGRLCPWCIASGEASAKFEIEFSDGHPLLVAAVPVAAVEEVMLRTPGYDSWQQECWLSCCGDACEFHGDASTDEMRALTEIEVARIAESSGYAIELLNELVGAYEPGGNPSIYKFVCRHCGRSHYGLDGA